MKYTVWGSELSPFSLKVRALLDFACVDYDWAPADVSVRRGLACALRVERLKRGNLALTYPPFDAMSEFPLVPFVFTDEGHNLYDSSAIARWLDDHHTVAARKLIPADPACGFVAQLIDDHFDEFGLYVAHHHRWVTSAFDNDAGERMANEFWRFLPASLRLRVAQWFARRQVRRLPYLFSVAPEGYRVQKLDRALTSPSRPGFPPTHRLLEEAFTRSLDLVEAVLRERRFLFGDRFTLADASLYGQLGMNTSDPSADALIAERAPTLRAWLDRLHDRQARLFGDAQLPDPSDIQGLEPLLDEIVALYVPLMQQNERAYQDHAREGQTRFNELAFDRAEALYDGELLGHPFRSVAKTFQVKDWRALKARYAALDHEARASLPPAVTLAFDDAIGAKSS